MVFNKRYYIGVKKKLECTFSTENGCIQSLYLNSLTKQLKLYSEESDAFFKNIINPLAYKSCKNKAQLKNN